MLKLLRETWRYIRIWFQHYQIEILIHSSIIGLIAIIAILYAMVVVIHDDPNYIRVNQPEIRNGK